MLARARPELAPLVSGDGNEDPWPDRKPLATLPSVPALPAHLIPYPVRDWLVDLADRACIPLEFLACPALVALGGSVGRAFGIRPSRYDDFMVVPNLWGGLSAGRAP